MTKIIKILFLFLIIIFALLAIVFGYFFVGSAPRQENILWGVNFSQMGAENLKLNWKKTYLALLDDLGAKKIKLITNWDFVESKRGEYYFSDIDWQLQEAEKHNVELIYVVGIKTGRWPECHDPQWAKQLSVAQEQQQLLNYVKEVILRYKNSKSIIAWQVENEPLFKFGQCPWHDKKFLKREVEFVKSLDPSRPIIISDSGEQSLWFGAAKIGDKVGTTMYRKVWGRINDEFGFHIDSFLPPVYYWRKAELIKRIFGKEVIAVELQAEPWASKLFYDVPVEEQLKTMNLEQFQKNIEYAKRTGLKEFYFWGSEWWYWMKTTQNQPEIWDEAKTLFKF